ncbi:MAG TPA: hypothetical protein VL357_03355 [Rariglobus sp.]|jgi:hypothetical protein|nr:hypothetical protein [Rariglobus sp.]
MHTLIQRFHTISTQPFERVIARLEAAVGHPDIHTFQKEMAAANTHDELKQIVHNAVGPSGLIEFVRFNIGVVNRRVQNTETPRSIRFLIGNPLIMQSMVVHVPDAASYAPVTILIDERLDGVRLSYDKMVGFLTPYGNAQALKVAQELDNKIEALLTAASL